MEELLWTVAHDYLLPALASIIGALIAAGGAYLTAYIRRLHINAASRDILGRLNDVVFQVVLEMEQTVVADIKAAMQPDSDGGKRLTKKEAMNVRDKAVKKVRKYLGRPGMALLMRVLGLDSKGADDLIVSKVEAEVATRKGNGL